jgi:hypothetical protein
MPGPRWALCLDDTGVELKLCDDPGTMARAPTDSRITSPRPGSGFDAPETCRARCAGERELGNRATFRLRQLIAGGGSTWRWWSARARLGPRAP